MWLKQAEQTLRRRRFAGFAGGFSSRDSRRTGSCSFTHGLQIARGRALGAAVVGHLFGAFSQNRRDGDSFLSLAIQGPLASRRSSRVIVAADRNLQRGAQLIGRANQTPDWPALFTSSPERSTNWSFDIDREQQKRPGCAQRHHTDADLLGQRTQRFDSTTGRIASYVQADQQFRSNPQKQRDITTCGRRQPDDAR